jgi:hypothetical protein
MTNGGARGVCMCVFAVCLFARVLSSKMMPKTSLKRLCVCCELMCACMDAHVRVFVCSRAVIEDEAQDIFEKAVCMLRTHVCMYGRTSACVCLLTWVAI